MQAAHAHLRQPGPVRPQGQPAAAARGRQGRDADGRRPGWGDPFEREPEAVLRDVADGFVSRERAASRYGVAIVGTPPAVDAEATRELRRGRPG